MKAAIYARFSSDNQRSESIDAQVRAIKKYCEDENIEIIGTYVDEAKSATTDQRPAFQRLIHDAKKKQFEAVIVHKLDRFSRNRKDSITYKGILRKECVEVISVTEPLNDSPESVILESVIEGMAEYYSLNLSREVRKGLTENALQCKHTGGTPPLGYDVDSTTRKLIVNDHEAQAVKFIFQAVLDGKGYKKIIKDLNDRGFKTKKGKPFGKNSIYEILHNEKYRGVYLYNKRCEKDLDHRRNNHKTKEETEIIRIEKGVPALVSDEDFFCVQENMKSRRNIQENGHAKETYLLSGMVRCGECGAAFCGSRKYSGRNKKLHVTYRCNQRVSKTAIACHNKEINRDDLEEIILEAFGKDIFSAVSLSALSACVNNLSRNNQDMEIKAAAGLEKNLKAVKKKMENLIEVIAKTGNIAIVEALEELEGEKKKLEQEIRKAKKIKKNKGNYSAKEVTAAFNRLREEFMLKNPEVVRPLLSLFLKEVVVYDDHITIQYNDSIVV